MFAIKPRFFDDLDVVFFDHLRPSMSSTTLPAASTSALLRRRRNESEVHNTDREFRIRLELYEYKPEEIRITADKKHVTVTAKHEEREASHGFVSRKITRRYKLPDNVDPQSLKSSMNSQGVLCIRGQKKEETCREVPITVEYKSSRDW
ncbi:unnamed protein product [Candidula unifasciata]|uniref:SHSP domain-containing protein n=1 Tax=Candidula unifasciata TaxID=100452 RepID=A0A8S3ZGB2_9EUPU|nr:unnamed protein product [Candidula unifasciata]